MKNTLIQACVAGLLALTAISAQAEDGKVKDWVKEDQQKASPKGSERFSNVVGSAMVVEGAVMPLSGLGAGLYQYAKSTELHEKAKEAAKVGRYADATHLRAKAIKAESKGGFLSVAGWVGGWGLLIPTGELGDMVFNNMQYSERLEAAKIVAQKEKAKAAQPIGGTTLEASNANVSAH
jgi:hypothetical protein